MQMDDGFRLLASSQDEKNQGSNASNTNNANNNNINKSPLFFKRFSMSREEFLFTLLSAIAVTISYADRTNIATAIIPMEQQFHWDPFFSGIVLSSFWIGYMLSQVLGGSLADRFGGEWIVVIALLTWSLCTGLTPIAATWGKAPLLIVRIVLGFGEGLALPSIHTMISKYVKTSNQSSSAAIVTGACYLGALLSNLIAPSLIALGGYQLCFLMFALIPPIVWLPSWILFTRTYSYRRSSVLTNETFPLITGGVANSNSGSTNSSNDSNSSGSSNSSDSSTESMTNNNNNNITNNHNDTLKQSQTQSTHGTIVVVVATTDDAEVELEAGHNDEMLVDKSVSVWSLLQYSPVWAIVLGQYGQSWGMYGLLSWLPSYYNQQFHVSLDRLSSFTVLPYFLQMVVAFIAGVIVDKLIAKGYRKMHVRNWFQVVGMIVPAFCLTLCASIPTLTVYQTSALINIGTAASALTAAGVTCSQLDLSPINAGTIFAIGNTAACLGGLIAIPLAGFIYEATQSWNFVFVTFVAHYLLGLTSWLYLTSDKQLLFK